MTTTIRSKLSIMMFLEYLIWGTWFVDMGNYMAKQLAASGGDIGIAYGNAWFGAIISPFFIGAIADRYFSAQKVNGVLHILGGILLYFATQITDVGQFKLLILVYSLAFMPTIGLTNAISFSQTSDAAKDFPLLRVLGTIAWIVGNLLVDGLGWAGTSQIFLAPAVLSFVFGIYSFTLPNVAPDPNKKTNIFDGFALFKDRSYAIFFIGSILLCIPLGFYYAHAKNFLVDSKLLTESTIGSSMAIFGQGSEIIFMLALPFFLKKWGYRNILLIGMAAWVARYLLFKFGLDISAAWMLLLGVALHGISYDFFFATGQIYTNEKANASNRSAAQGLITFATYGIGLTSGSWFSALIAEKYLVKGAIDWSSLWLVPAGIAGVILVVFLGLFKEKEA